MCNATFPTVDSTDVKIYSVIGEHKAGKSIHDVDVLILENSASEYLRNNIGAHLPNLRNIYLENNSLKFITRENFKFMQNVVFLSLANNQITELSNQFDDLVNLEYLLLSGNQIKILPAQLLKKLKKLTNLHAVFNQIEYLEAGFFDANKKIEKIIFACNKLTKVTKFKFLDLYRNDSIDKIYVIKYNLLELEKTRLRNDAQMEVFGKYTNFIADESVPVNETECSMIPRHVESFLWIIRSFLT